MHIDSYSFGVFVVDGKTYESDIKLVDSEIRFWHDHGLSLDDVKDVVEAKPKVIIIGTGASGVVEVSKEIQDYIKGKGIKLIIEMTGKACKVYNELSAKEPGKIAAILHSTC